MDKEKIIAEANYIIDNKATISKTAEHFNISTSSIKKHINDSDKLQSIDEELYKKVKKVQEEIIQKGVIKGGQTGKRSSILDEKKKIDIAVKIIRMRWTLDQASANIGVPRSTLYENLMSIKDKNIKEELRILFDENRQMKGVKIYEEDKKDQKK